MLDAARVKQHRLFGRPPDFGAFDDAGGGDAGDFFGVFGRVLFDELANGVPTFGVFGDEVLVNPSVLHHHVQDAVAERAVATGADR